MSINSAETWIEHPEPTGQLTEIPETSQQPKRYASDFYGIWKGVVFSEDDFKAAEWHPNDDWERL